MNGYSNEDLNQIKECLQTITSKLKDRSFEEFDQISKAFKDQYGGVAACDEASDQLGQLNHKIKNLNGDILDLQKEIMGMLNIPGSNQV